MPSPEQRAGAPWRPVEDHSALARGAAGLARRLAPLLARLGVDPAQFRIVLATRLALDQRGRGGRAGSVALGPTLALVLFWLTGMVPGVLALLGLQPGPWMAASQAMNMGLVALLLFLHYGHVLVEPTDLGLVESRPVSGRTLFAARLAHIAVHLALLEALFCFFPMLLGAIGLRAWQVLPLFPLCSLLASALVLGAVGLAYALALRLFGPRRFRAVTLGLQIAGTVLVTSAGALASPVSRALVDHGDALADPRLGAWLPPLQFGALFELSLGRLDPRTLTLSALAVGLPLAALALTLVVASRQFVAGARGALRAGEARSSTWPRGLLRRRVDALCTTRAELAGSAFAFGLAGRDRVFLGAAWPALCATVVPMLAVGVSLSALPRVREAVWIAAPYLVSVGLLAVAETTRVCETPAAAVSLRAAPLARPGRFLAGALAAVLARTVLPVLALGALAQVALLGPAALADAALAAIAALAIGLAGLGQMRLALPFTEELRIGDARWENLPIVFATMGLAVLAGALHALAWWLLPGLVRIPLALALMLLAWRLARRSWVRVLELDPEPLKLAG